MFLDVIVNLIEVFWTLLKPLIIVGAAFIALMIILSWIHILYLRLIKKQVKPTGVHVKLKKRNFFLKLFYDAPKQIAKDYMTRNPEFFKYQGLIIFTGRQGTGKSTALARATLDMKREYPKSRIIGNMDFKGQDDVLDHWTKLIDYKNGIQGVIAQIDETQNWFSSNQSKDFPPQMLEVITQNRKNRRVILGTAQSFNRLAKPIREQTTEIRECHTFAGCITIVIRKEPILNHAGEVEKYKNRGFYWFVHDEELRNSFDTYKVIESLRESGFAPAVGGDATNNINLVVTKKDLKKLK